MKTFKVLKMAAIVAPLLTAYQATASSVLDLDESALKAARVAVEKYASVDSALMPLVHKAMADSNYQFDREDVRGKLGLLAGFDADVVAVAYADFRQSHGSKWTAKGFLDLKNLFNPAFFSVPLSAEERRNATYNPMADVINKAYAGVKS